MGVIKDGKISGTLPNSEAFSVNYPGYPKTTARAIQTLGGTEGILKTRSSQSNRLELHFRPEDPYSHPTFGDLRLCNNFLLKISKKKCSSRETAEASTSGVADSEIQEQPVEEETKLCADIVDSEIPEQPVEEEEKTKLCADIVDSEIPEQSVEEEEEKTELCADIISRVSESYNFDGMADYQHVLPVHANAARKRKRNWEEAEEAFFEKNGFMDVDQEDLMMILPPLFSPKDIPENVVLRPSSLLKKKQEGFAQYSAEVDLEPALAIDFNIKEVPKAVNWEEYITKGSEQWEWQMTVSKLFDERPIWPKESVTVCLLEKGLKFSYMVLKRLLLGVAYYFSNGPFLRFWIRKGYDPRKDPDSRIYQRTEFRVPEPLRNYADANKLTHKWGDLCTFKVFPYKCQMIFQLFELDDDYIQQEIRKPPKLETCSSKTGWFQECVLDCLRLRVAVRFLSVYPGTGAESILKSHSDEFEKLKRSCIYKDVFNCHQEEQQQTNTGDEDKERPKSSDNEADEVEADDEDELDVYETLDQGYEDDEIYLQPDNYLDMGNNSRTYLQELFGSFPSTASGADAMQAADYSDGEYEIYEQFSDNNYSEEDDDNDS